MQDYSCTCVLCMCVCVCYPGCGLSRSWSCRESPAPDLRACTVGLDVLRRHIPWTALTWAAEWVSVSALCLFYFDHWESDIQRDDGNEWTVAQLAMLLMGIFFFFYVPGSTQEEVKELNYLACILKSFHIA